MKIYHVNVNQKKAEGDILVPDKADFKARKITRDREGHYIMTKRSIHQEDMVILNVISPNNRVAKYVK